MLISKYWAVCRAESYSPFIPSLKPVAYLSDDLFSSMLFLKPNLCDLVIRNEESKKYEKYEFYVLPSCNETEKDIFYDDHTVSIPLEIYHKLLGFDNPKLLSVRTDVL